MTKTTKEKRPAPRKPAPAATQLSRLPSVDAVLATGVLQPLSREAAVAAVRERLEALREALRAGGAVDPASMSAAAVAEAARAALQQASAPRLRRVVNATGIVLHTNLGRASLAPLAVDAVVEAARGAVNLEYDLEGGERGDRDRLVEEHLCALTGAEAATVVNNNAAAVILALNSLAEGREVVVSRGELVEIGGSFRIPDIMKKSGAVLREVGTTNRTHASDYRAAIGADTALLMKVHASNYRIVGFSSSVEVEELAAMAAMHEGVHVVEDLGAGALVDLAALSRRAGVHGLAPEPVVADCIRAGADLVLASGDKLLGGPQCGLAVGRRALVDRLRRNPLKRALRCDKLTLAALEATLRLYRFAASPEREIPTLARLLRPVAELRESGRRAAALLAEALGEGWTFEVVDSEAQAGSGSQPDVSIPSVAVAVRAAGRSASAIERFFRSARTPIVGRIRDDVFLLDLRVVDDPAEVVPT